MMTTNFVYKGKNTNLSFTLGDDAEKKEFIELLKEAQEDVVNSLTTKSDE